MPQHLAGLGLLLAHKIVTEPQKRQVKRSVRNELAKKNVENQAFVCSQSKELFGTHVAESRAIGRSVSSKSKVLKGWINNESLPRNSTKRTIRAPIEGSEGDVLKVIKRVARKNLKGQRCVLCCFAHARAHHSTAQHKDPAECMHVCPYGGRYEMHILQVWISSRATGGSNHERSVRSRSWD